MPCFTAAKRARIIAEIETKESQLDELNTAYLAAIKNSEVEEYAFNSGEGSQRTKRRSIKEIRQEIEYLESSIDRLYRRLNGTTLINMSLRRKSYNRRYR